ncbi:C40 family peptidase [Haloechinothrix salitolerans]|uniref:C40 family peptidase n=1 Tax=Haloechinothrix salitolerans TaxID=926830 RepID=A0ABW2C8B4_9PSEU
MLKIAGAAVAGSVVFLLVLGAALIGGATLTSNACGTTPGPGEVPNRPLTHEQIAIARIIVDTTAARGLPRRAAVLAVATALVESDLRNLDGGDRDSVGVYQQRPSQGWGSPSQLRDPIYATNAFLDALTAIPGWQHLPDGVAEQHVQRSAFPDRYAPRHPAAEALVGRVGSGNWQAIPEDHEQFVSTCLQTGSGHCVDIPAPSRAAMNAINYACGQLGLPYVWGGDGPAGGDAGFDCSGLTNAAYEAAGVSLPRTAQTQYDAGPLVPAGQPIRPGDLVFFGSSPDAVTHVGIAVSSEKMIDAPHAGSVVRIERIWQSNFVGATRPAK